MLVRRVSFAGLVTVSFLLMAALMAITLSPGGFGLLDIIIFVSFLVTLPWTIIGFWNATIGLLIMRFSRDPANYVCPINHGDDTAGTTSRTAILSCIRNEEVNRLEKNLSVMLEDLTTSAQANNFTLYVLSDSSDNVIAASERRMADRLRKIWGNQIPVIYRRRENNPGFKAGNIRDFCERWGGEHDFALVLDADSFMTADAILTLVRRMEANPKLGILQSLAVGLPSASAFARVFQFGMRLGMRSYTIGSAWWQGECGPYWGHNAVLRLEPFKQHCVLPDLPGKGPLAGPILSHDQVEAVLMRRAGYEVRVLPQEGGSYEENPPHLLEFIRRDLRWCQGNLQYRRLLTMKGLKPISRIQLALAMLMFLSSPAWLSFMISAAILGLTATDFAPFRPDTGLLIFVAIMTMVFAPKIATVLDILVRPSLRRQFGGGIRVVISTVCEVVYAAMMAPMMAVAHTLFMAGLAFGKTIGWGAQARGVARLPVGLAMRKLWPQTLFGVMGTAWVMTQPLSLVWPVLPITVGPLLAVPFAILLSTRFAGLLGTKSTLWRIPEESDPPEPLFMLDLPAFADAGNSRPEPVVAATASAAEAPT
ncbi:glucans biosynthesis glucosyltransferase MdoH [Roseibium sp. RKSG952]|uniref:glucans biosynthesis glucosyltransferase MdoH n=1 Tax=Roseibium sp. RKSG952 TaxID=2529384 RepID=UPI0012BD140B|nr:glucans biosynthesis glucosyltransferase MdoH [Roseibium sp. RKSG952]MTI00007.1 glucans biosynthesis glucosyltransferase MdoH [Roseibium sp. RKSG952]